MARSNLHTVKKTVRGKSGKTFQRTMLVKSCPAPKCQPPGTRMPAKVANAKPPGFLRRHAGKIAAVAAVATTAAVVHRRMSKMSGTAPGLHPAPAAKATGPDARYNEWMRQVAEESRTRRGSNYNGPAPITSGYRGGF